MRIINGHDYYDSALVYGHDPKVVFVRGDAEAPDKTFSRPYADFRFVKAEKAKSKNVYWRHKFDKISVKDGTWYFCLRRIIFCGKLYTGVECKFQANWALHPRLTADKETQVFWNEDDFTEWLNQFGVVLITETSWRQEDNYLFKVVDLIGDEYDYLVTNRVSIAVYDGSKKVWKINCIGLRDLQFYRVFDAVRTFQELDMWMSGALGMPGNPTVEVSDEYRMQKHGMDKWSFRKKVR